MPADANASAVSWAAEAGVVIKGSVAGELYGLNGIGRGWMPGFGTVLSENDLMLIVRFERALR